MHVKDIHKEKMAALFAAIAQSMPGIDPTLRKPLIPKPRTFSQHQVLTSLARMSHNGSPHQGKREMERRRKRMLAGKIKEANGLVRGER